MRNLSQEALAKRCGLKQSAVAHIETGRNQNSKFLPQIAAQLQVSYEWLLSGRGDINESSRLVVDGDVRQIPVRSLSDFNSGTVMLSTAKEFLNAPRNVGKSSFAILIASESMSTRYPPGMYIIVDPSLAKPANGKRILARVNGMATFREYREEMGQRLLVPLNPQYPTITMPENFEMIGTVVGSYLPE